MQKINTVLVFDLWDVHNIRVNVEDKRMSFFDAVESEARTQGIQVVGTNDVVLPEKHLYLKGNILEALSIALH
ncbi:hypothetical protein NYE59_23015 [Paenibacillus sp. FSL L8-0323]|uniref:hypothetical protein n=1 Tax=Paenibacillus sp. FSL L8-0323 TaxID=2975330 RepID=UPI0030F60395